MNEISVVSNSITIYGKHNKNFNKLVEIFQRAGHADPLASAARHQLVRRPDGHMAIIAKADVLTFCSGNEQSVGATYLSYADRLGLKPMTRDESRLVLSELGCSLEIGEVTPVSAPF